MARTLAERLRAHEQNKARLAEVETKLRLAERKQRTRRLVEAGALLDKTGLLELDSNALYGALLSLRDGADTPKQVEQWAALGGRAFAREARARDEGKQPILLTFPASLGKDAALGRPGPLRRCRGARRRARRQHPPGRRSRTRRREPRPCQTTRPASGGATPSGSPCWS